jgi:hypothetical protein
MRSRAVAATALLLALSGCAGQPEQRAEVFVQPVTPTTTAAAEPSATSTPNLTALPPPRTTPAPGARWLHWHPRYQAVRRATAEELSLLGNRVTARNASEWTATDVLRGVEVAFTPTHVRVRVPRAALYFRLRPGGPRHLFVTCIESGCGESGRDAAWGPERTNPYLERMTGYVRDLVAQQTRPGLFRSRGPVWLATVRSPDGTLSCVVVADRRLPVSRLEGRPVGSAGVLTRCVDTHGLVVPLDLGLPPGGWSVVDGVSGGVRVSRSDINLF